MHFFNHTNTKVCEEIYVFPNVFLFCATSYHTLRDFGDKKCIDPKLN